jgi:hypothetical protein
MGISILRAIGITVAIALTLLSGCQSTKVLPVTGDIRGWINGEYRTCISAPNSNGQELDANDLDMYVSKLDALGLGLDCSRGSVYETTSTNLSVQFTMKPYEKLGPRTPHYWSCVRKQSSDDNTIHLDCFLAALADKQKRN